MFSIAITRLFRRMYSFIVVVVNGAMETERVPLVAVFAVGVLLSVTLTVKLEVPALVGAPEIAPLEDRLKPAGRDPEATTHVYGAVPPLAATEAL